MKNPKVFIIVLNYNGKTVLPKCLDSLYKLNYDNFEVVVVDNNSTDGSFEEAKIKFGKFHFIKNSSNLGFAGGNNVAIKWALEKMADYIWLLNNDTTVKEKSLTKLIEGATSQKAKQYGIFSPIIYDKNNKIWFSGGKINWLKMRTEHTRNTEYKMENNKRYMSNKLTIQQLLSTNYITGCAMLVKKEVFAKIGLLDNIFFLYYEDADFSWRAQKAGFKLGIISSAKIIHKEKSSENPEKLYWLVLSGILFFKKNATWFHKPYLVIYLFLRQMKNYYKLKGGKDNNTTKLIQKAYQDSKKKLKKD